MDGAIGYVESSDASYYLYTPTCIEKNQSTLCPSGWNIPTGDDFTNIRVALNSKEAFINGWGLTGRYYSGAFQTTGAVIAGTDHKTGDYYQAGSNRWYYYYALIVSTQDYSTGVVYHWQALPVRCVK
jgi:hypothetical protein